MMTKSGHIAVCLCAFNAERFVGQAIESILTQSYKNFHLFLVNDASTDETLSIAKKYLSDSRLTIISLKENIGTYAAKNLVLKNFADGEYWAHHDADDYSDQYRFEKQIVFMNNNHLDGCGTAICEYYEEGLSPRIPGSEPIKSFNNGVFRVNYYPDFFHLTDMEVDINDLAKIKIAMNGSLILKLESLRDLGGFDGTTRVAGDTDLLWRFIKLYRFGNTRDVLYHRRFHRTSLTQDSSTGFDSEYRKNYARLIIDRHIQTISLLRKGKIQEARRQSVESFFYPEVEYIVLKK